MEVDIPVAPAVPLSLEQRVEHAIELLEATPTEHMPVGHRNNIIMALRFLRGVGV